MTLKKMYKKERQLIEAGATADEIRVELAKIVRNKKMVNAHVDTLVAQGKIEDQKPEQKQAFNNIENIVQNLDADSHIKIKDIIDSLKAKDLYKSRFEKKVQNIITSAIDKIDSSFGAKEASYLNAVAQEVGLDGAVYSKIEKEGLAAVKKLDVDVASKFVKMAEKMGKKSDLENIIESEIQQKIDNINSKISLNDIVPLNNLASKFGLLDAVYKKIEKEALQFVAALSADSAANVAAFRNMAEKLGERNTVDDTIKSKITTAIYAIDSNTDLNTIVSLNNLAKECRLSGKVYNKIEEEGLEAVKAFNATSVETFRKMANKLGQQAVFDDAIKSEINTKKTAWMNLSETATKTEIDKAVAMYVAAGGTGTAAEFKKDITGAMLTKQTAWRSLSEFPADAAEVDKVVKTLKALGDTRTEDVIKKDLQDGVINIIKTLSDTTKVSNVVTSLKAYGLNDDAIQAKMLELVKELAQSPSGITTVCIANIKAVSKDTQFYTKAQKVVKDCVGSSDCTASNHLDFFYKLLGGIATDLHTSGGDDDRCSSGTITKKTIYKMGDANERCLKLDEHIKLLCENDAWKDQKDKNGRAFLNLNNCKENLVDMPMYCIETEDIDRSSAPSDTRCLTIEQEVCSTDDAVLSEIIVEIAGKDVVSTDGISCSITN